MNGRDVAVIGGLLADAGESGLRLRWAVVSATSTGPARVTLLLSGSSVTTPAVRYLASYTPVVGQVVAVLQQGSDLLVLGTLAA